MNIVFVADAHLKGLDDPNQASLVEFFDGLDGVDLLVILGDLFDCWGGGQQGGAQALPAHARRPAPHP